MTEQNLATILGPNILHREVKVYMSHNDVTTVYSIRAVGSGDLVRGGGGGVVPFTRRYVTGDCRLPNN